MLPVCAAGAAMHIMQAQMEVQGPWSGLHALKAQNSCLQMAEGLGEAMVAISDVLLTLLTMLCMWGVYHPPTKGRGGVRRRLWWPAGPLMCS